MCAVVARGAPVATGRQAAGAGAVYRAGGRAHRSGIDRPRAVSIGRTRIDTRHSDETFKHILLPIWTAAYKYNGKSYRFVVNGQTGEVQGERPYSWWKIGFAVLAVVVVSGVALVLSDPSAFGINPADLPDWLN